MAITASMVKELREMTGVGMLECKKALAETDGDMEKAVELLREKGLAASAKKAGRIASEGLVDIYVSDDKKTAAIVEVNSETDFVAKSDPFKALVNETADILLNEKPACINCAKKATEELYTNATVKIGEKLDLRRFELLTKTDAQTFGGYVHMGGKISTLLLIDGNISQEDANGLAMHVAANAPLYISTADIPAAEVEKETNIQLEAAKQDPKLAGKPEEMLKKIIAGKVSKYFSESVFVEQEYLMAPGVKVGQWLKEHGVKVVKMIRFMTGEGIEKREDNFAEEVAKQMA